MIYLFIIYLFIPYIRKALEVILFWRKLCATIDKFSNETLNCEEKGLPVVPTELDMLSAGILEENNDYYEHYSARTVAHKTMKTYWFQNVLFFVHNDSDVWNETAE